MTTQTHVVFRYLARQFTASFGIVLLLLLGVTYLFDTVELLRRLAGKGEASLFLALKMSAYKLPEVGLQITAFAVLFSAVLMLRNLSKTRELVVLRGAGISVWQFLVPLLSVALLLGVAKPALLQPFGAALLQRYEALESTYLGGQSSQIKLSRSGLWLRQVHPEGYAVLHARTVKAETSTFRDVALLIFSLDGTLLRRIDAKDAFLNEDMQAWQFPRAWLNIPEQTPIPLLNYNLPTALSMGDLIGSHAAPETISFWRLPEYLRLMETAGFPTASMRMHYFSMLAEPLLALGLVLLAAAVAMPRSRQAKLAPTVLWTLAIAFGVFFLGDVLKVFGISALLPIPAAAIAPAALATVAGVAALLYTEDG